MREIKNRIVRGGVGRNPVEPSRVIHWDLELEVAILGCYFAPLRGGGRYLFPHRRCTHTGVIGPSYVSTKNVRPARRTRTCVSSTVVVGTKPPGK